MILKDLSPEQIETLSDAIKNGEVDPYELYRSHAIANASEKYDNNHLALLAGIGLGFIAFPFVGWLGAAGMALCAGQSVINRGRKGTQVIEQIEAGQAPLEDFLDREDKRLYLRWKKMNEVKALPAAPETKALPPVEETDKADEAIAQVEAEGEETAIAPSGFVPSELHYVTDDAPVVATPITVPQDVPQGRTAMHEILKAPLYTRIFLGGQRSGKSYGVSQVSRYLQQQNETKVFAINLALVKNPEYWDHADRKVIADLTAADVDKAIAIQSIKEARAVLDEFKRHKNALLIIDEWTIIGATTFKFNEQLRPFIDDVCSTITTLSSRGLQASQAVWLIAPHCRLDFLEKSAKALKLCKLCLVAANPVQPFDVGGNQISFDWELFDQVKNNWRDIVPPEQGIDSLSAERIAFINSQWMPLGNVNAPAMPCPPPTTPASSAPSQDVTNDDLEQKLLLWLQGTGKKHADEEGWIPAPTILKSWRYKKDGKTQASDKQEIFNLVKGLKDKKQIQVKKGGLVKAV